MILKNIAVINILEQVWDFDEDLSYTLFENSWPYYELKFYTKKVKN